MKTNNNITGIILSGGKSSRMGSDKGFVLYKNKPFIQHVIDAMQPLVNEIIIVSDNPAYDSFKLKRINDSIKDAGPLAGLYSGLQASKTELNIVLSCDVPLMNTKTLQKLIDEVSDEIDVIQIKSKGKEMPLIAMYKKHCKAVCYSLLEEGERRLRIALEQLKVKTITLDEFQEKFTENINTQDDLKKISNAIKY